MKKLIILIGIAGLVLACGNAFAAPIYCPLNGHYYEAIHVDYSWTEAKTHAQNRIFDGAHGYLATLTSQAENDWVWNNVLTFGHPSLYWLGGFQSPTNEGAANGWQWVTGEEWSWTNWKTGEPNDWLGRNENRLDFANNGSGKWNDDMTYATSYGYIVEYVPTSTPTPEPATMSLLGLGTAGLFIRRKKKIIG